MIAREGLVPIGVASVAALVVNHYHSVWWALPLWIVTAYLLYLFRETTPTIPNLPLAVLSPGNGRVAEVAEAHDSWLDRDSRRMRVLLNGLGIGVLRSPVEGKVMDYWTSARPFNRPASERDSGFSPNCYSVWVRTDEGDDVVVAISSLRPISRFKLYVSPGERVGIGQRIGFIYFADVVEVFMPLNARAEAAAGSETQAGCTVLGHLVRVS
jgi:phosphatidylserine decarboxylase